MKKLFSFLIASVLFVSVFSFSAFAKNTVGTIDVDVVLLNNGDAKVTQVWTGEFDEGTECYFEFITKDILDVSNLKVMRGGEKYKTLDEWDVDASFSKKANKCGLNKTDNGYEICWGISQYGENTYTVSYTIKNLVCAYSESDGFNSRFINSGMDTTPTAGTVKISTQSKTKLTDSNTNIWAFGYHGQIAFQNDGTVLAYTQKDIEKDGNMTVMLELNKGVLTPAYTSDETFESAVKEPAMEGSDYDDDDVNTKDLLMFAAVAVVVLIALISFIVSRIIRKSRIKKFSKNSGYFRDIPNGGNINMTYAFGRAYDICTENSIIGARLLKLIVNGYLEPVEEKDVGFMGRDKSKINLRIAARPQKEADEYDHILFMICEEAAGENGILEQKELKKYCDKHPSSLREFINKSHINGSDSINANNCSAGSYKSLGKLTDIGKKELSEIMGLKNYLNDFSLLSEHSVQSAQIWQDYMVYAMLYGIAEKVAKELKKIFPESIAEIESYERNVIIVNNYNFLMYNALINREQRDRAARSGGSGGASSFGGGGGFSGGGFSGGTR